MKNFNGTVLMSGVEWFDDAAAINPFMDASISVDREKARDEHEAIRAALESAGVEVVKVGAPAHCQDGVYTANWALVRGKKAVLARLPNARTAEEAYAQKTFPAAIIFSLVAATVVTTRHSNLLLTCLVSPELPFRLSLSSMNMDKRSSTRHLAGQIASFTTST